MQSYFDLEEYSDESTQSIKRYSDSKTWVNKFYRPYLMKCWNYLASGGYMGIYISPIRGLNLEQITIDTLSIMKQAKYLGKGGYIAHIRDVKIRSLIVFQKN